MIIITRVPKQITSLANLRCKIFKRAPAIKMAMAAFIRLKYMVLIKVPFKNKSKNPAIDPVDSPMFTSSLPFTIELVKLIIAKPVIAAAAAKATKNKSILFLIFKDL